MKNKKGCYLICIVFILVLSASSNADSVKKTITQSLGFIPTSLDPVYATKEPDKNFLKNIFEGLMDIDEKGQVVAGQAKSWAISKDGKVYTFYLKDNIYWNDGMPVIADDFYLGFSRQLDPEINAFSKSSYMLTIIQGVGDYLADPSPQNKKKLGVRVIDNKTIEFTLSRPAPFFLSIASESALWPVPSHVIKEKGEKWAVINQKLVSNGAYNYISTAGDTIICAKNTTYYKADSVYYDELKSIVVKNDGQAAYLFNSNKLHLIREYRGSQMEEIRNGRIILLTAQATTYITLNNNSSKFQDKNVRRALSLALQRDQLVKRVPNIKMKPVYTFAADSVINQWTRFKPAWESWDSNKRLKEAQRLMKLAGYNESNKLKIELSTNIAGSNEQFVNAVSSFWVPIYVEATVKPKAGRDHYKNLRDGAYEAARAKWVADFDDPSNFLNLLKSTSQKNYANWNSAKYDLLLKKLLEEVSLKKRVELIKEMENLILEEMPIIPVFTEGRQLVISNKIKLNVGSTPSYILIKHLRPDPKYKLDKQ